MRNSVPADAENAGRPHIAFVLPGLRAGGSEHIVSLLCNHFSQSGWRVSLFAFEEAGVPPYYAHDSAVRITQLGHPSGRLRPFQALANLRARISSLRRALAWSRPDLVISFLTRTNVISVLAAGPLSIPVIVSERNNPAQQRPGLVWSLLRRLAYARAHGLITMTAGAMNQFPKAMRRREWVIPNPTYAPVIPDETRKPGRKIVAVGRLVPQKGFDLLIDAFAGVADKIADWSLVIFGEGPERARLEAQRDALGLRDRIVMPGVTQEHGGWLRNADIFVLSSRYEGWGIVVGEAMAAAIPTISFDCQWGPGEMIEDDVSGLLVADGDVSALGAAMEALCCDPDRRRRLADGALVASKRFSVDRILAQWEEVARSVHACPELAPIRQGPGRPGEASSENGPPRNAMAG